MHRKKKKQIMEKARRKGHTQKLDEVEVLIVI